MIEKRIGYQEDSGRKNVKAAELIAKKPLPKDWEPKYINGNIIDLTPLLDDRWWEIETPDDDDDSARKIPRFRRKIPEVDINKYENYEVASGRNKEGIMKVASAKDDRDYLKMLLARYYTPHELFGKTIKELNKMLEMYINVHGGLI